MAWIPAIKLTVYIYPSQDLLGCQGGLGTVFRLLFFILCFPSSVFHFCFLLAVYIYPSKDLLGCQGGLGTVFCLLFLIFFFSISVFFCFLLAVYIYPSVPKSPVYRRVCPSRRAFGQNRPSNARIFAILPVFS